MYTRVYLEITNICNKSCSFCPKNRRAPHSMTMEEFDLAVRSIAPVTDKTVKLQQKNGTSSAPLIGGTGTATCDKAGRRTMFALAGK